MMMMWMMWTMWMMTSRDHRRRTDLKTLAASHTPRWVLAVLRTQCSTNPNLGQLTRIGQRCLKSQRRDDCINSVSTAEDNYNDSKSMSNHVAHNTSTTDSTSTSINLSSQIYTNDIACFLSNQRLKQSEIAKCLKLAWVPPPDFAFPEKIEGKQKRKFQYKYLTTFPWLAYSHQKEGAYCKQCILFAFSGGGIANQRLGKLVTEPMVKFKDAINEFKNHEKKEYHLLGGSKAVDVLLDKHKQQVIDSNRKRIVPIIKTILFCARNNLPLRGHRESGLLSSSEIRSSCLNGEQGVFRALLSFRVESGDTALLNHIETSPKNCTMISSRIQNEIIVAVGDVIVGKIVERIKKCKFFSILVDETTDISTIEQMTVCIRYVDTSCWIIREDFVGFVEMNSTTGLTIKNSILDKLKDIGLSINNLRGQGYDGGANMSGKNNGAQALIQNDQPLAFYTHCFSHSLNLCLSKACNVPSIKNMLGIVSCVATFFSASAKRADKLKSVIEADTTSNSEQSKKMKLKKLCETRWVERHDALITFKSLYIYLVHALEDLQNDTNLETSCKATLYLNSIMKSDFLVSLEVTVTGFSYTLQLSISLQSKQQDLSKALSDIMVIRCALEELRENADVNFKKMFKDIVEFAAKVDVEITLHTRFDDRLSDVMPLEGLIPSNFSFYDDDSILKAAMIYDKDLKYSDSSCLRAELHMWRCQWYNNDDKPQSVIDTLPHCTNLLPNIQVLLRLFATLPITSATPERTFSTLKRLKSYLRSTMTEERLNGLALANINKKENITELEIIQQFSKTSPKRLQLADWTK
ncbi:52 kDa repressor of the inhibitor of the protein kinase-like [Aphis gossypii]|uniref:52 kDa repressor of the inhibitor of the protein kinase-like n=1 Tax=Aphis gossypii TaxID=80765 RepID=UPI002159911A|nr:52 kDa repressor of the inhibitor of the protein kinase-like [Aphis gossypii]